MVRRCCIPFCKSGMKGGPKVSMFAPREDNLELWKEAIEKIKDDYKVTRKTVVCMLHFKPDDITTHDEMIIKGKLVRLKRFLPRLKPNAYPTVFSHLIKPVQRSANKRIAPEELFENIRVVEHITYEADTEPNECTNPNATSLSEIVYTTNILENTLVDSDPNCCILQPFTINTIYKEAENINLPNTVWAISQESAEEASVCMMDPLIISQESINDSNSSFTINSIHKEAKHIKLPNAMWAVCQEPNFDKTIFLHCSQMVTVDKTVIFTESCVPEIKFKKMSIMLLETEITSLEGLEKLIQTVDSLRPCEGTGINHSINCDGYAMLKSTNGYSFAFRCSPCRHLRRKMLQRRNIRRQKETLGIILQD